MLLLAGCHAGQTNAPDHPREFTGVAMRDVTFRSAALGRQMTYRVYLPENVPMGRRLPVVFLLHGGGGDFRDWSNYSDVGKYAEQGLILVMPEGNLSYWVNAALAPEDRFGDYLTNDLLVDVEGRFPVATDRAGRSIVGISMGGYTAVKLALTRPELFEFAGAISPAIHVPSMRFSWRRWGQSVRLRRVFGPDGSATRIASDPFQLVKAANAARTPYLYITAGDNDPMAAQIRSFVGILKQRGFVFEFHTKRGGHDWTEWNSQVPGCMEKLLSGIRSGR